MADSDKSDVVGIGLERSESEQVINAQATRNALAKQFVRWAILEDTTPSVMNVERLRFRNTTPTTVVAFDNGQEGQAIDILGDGFTTIEDNSQIATFDGNDLDLEDGIVYRFVRLSPTNRYGDGKWHQAGGGGTGGPPPGTGVDSFNARTGVVVPLAGDYPPAFIGAVPDSHLTDTDPHTQYQRESERAAASGYCPLDASSLVPAIHLPPAVAVVWALIGERVVPSGGEASWTFSSIPTTYRDLRVVVRGRISAAGNTIFVQLQFNADTAGNYDRTAASSTAGFTGFAEALAQTALSIGELTAASGTAGYIGTADAIIYDYRGTVFNKQVNSRCTVRWGTGANSGSIQHIGGGWRSAAAINAVKVLAQAGVFLQDTVISLYGIY